MKARTRLQREVEELSNYRLPNIGREVDWWAGKNCLEKVAYRNKTQIACLECGYSWDRDTDKKRCMCPHCQTKLKVRDTRARTLKQERSFVVLQTLERFQVNRYFLINGQHKIGERAVVRIREVCQQWLLEDGRYVIYGQRHKVNFTQDFWTGDFEVRSNKAPQYQYWKANLYNFNTEYVYPKMEILPVFKNRGLVGRFKGIAPLDVMRGVITDNRAESLLKMKQMDLLRYYLGRSHYLIDRYWKSICICQRNKYEVKDADMWLDYLECLENLEKDTRNAHYICPKNLKREHDKAVLGVRRRRARLKRENLKNRERRYREKKAPYIGFSAKENDIEIAVLNSVQEFKEEGDKMHHCVYASQYDLRDDCLILTARSEGTNLATIELSLKTWKIIQCRGERNSVPKRHDEIVSLVEREIPELQRRVEV